MGRAQGDASGTEPVFTELSARRLGPVRRFLARRPAVLDVLLALCFTAWAVVIGLGADSMYVLHAYLGGDRVAQMQSVLLVLIVGGAAALVWRRRRPVPVAAVMGGLGVVALATTGATSGFELGLALALFTVATTATPRATWVTLTVTVSAYLLTARVLELPRTVGAISLGVDPVDADRLEAVVRATRPAGFLQSAVWYQTAAPVLVLALLAVTLGTSARNRRLHLVTFLEQANALARDQEQRALLAQAAERARIAREMHDVVAHSISVMIALGGGAAAAMEWAPDRSRAALDDLVATGRAALGDVRRVLGVLHDDGDAPGGGEARDGDAPMEPQPGGLDLVALVERFRASGLPVRTTGLADTGLQELDANLQLTVYRIVQESLTNALRHAPGSPAVDVGVARSAERVEVVVTDQGATAPVDATPGSGRGLIGMRERVAAFGGSLEAGPYGRGWRIRALLPSHEGDA
jgi:signal transduction histidine kinase